MPKTGATATNGLGTVMGARKAADLVAQVDRVRTDLDAAQVLTTGATITTPTVGKVKLLDPAAAVTGIIMPTVRGSAALVAGEELTLINVSAFTITFAAAATSYVSDGTGFVLGPGERVTLNWRLNTTTFADSRWYRDGSVPSELQLNGVPGASASVRSIVVKKLAIADNTATSIITVTVPNGNHAAAIRLTLLGSLGTGTDTFESSRVAVGAVVLARQTGANVVPAAATLTLTQIATVSGGGTLTLAYGVSSVTGAVGATNTFDIQVTLVKTGTITDLQCVALAELINAEASGVTMAQSA